MWTERGEKVVECVRPLLQEKEAKQTLPGEREDDCVKESTAVCGIVARRRAGIE